MKWLIKQIGKRVLQAIDSQLLLSQRVDRVEGKIDSIARETQVLLSVKYRELLYKGVPLPRFEDIEFRAFSQNGEDGILLFIFALIGTTNRGAVEICSGDGIVCNTANLIVNHGWNALLFDGDEENVRRGRQFYSACRDTFQWPPTMVNAWITAENINSLIVDNGFEGDIDLLSLDMDGVDYWIWKAITCINPRVVAVEYNNLWGAKRAVTVPYQSNFRTEYSEFGADYAGASLPAFVKLGREKGYRLVGCQRYNYNAFFIRSGIGEDIFPEISASKCFDHPFAQHAMSKRLARIIDREWVTV